MNRPLEPKERSSTFPGSRDYKKPFGLLVPEPSIHALGGLTQPPGHCESPLFTIALPLTAFGKAWSSGHSCYAAKLDAFAEQVLGSQLNLTVLHEAQTYS